MDLFGETMWKVALEEACLSAGGTYRDHVLVPQILFLAEDMRSQGRKLELQMAESPGALQLWLSNSNMHQLSPELVSNLGGMVGPENLLFNKFGSDAVGWEPYCEHLCLTAWHLNCL